MSGIDEIKKMVMNSANRFHCRVFKYLKEQSCTVLLTFQQFIVSKLNTLSAETKKLKLIYQKKIDDLEELKKSILQKAFEGEL